MMDGTGLTDAIQSTKFLEFYRNKLCPIVWYNNFRYSKLSKDLSKVRKNNSSGSILHSKGFNPLWVQIRNNYQPYFYHQQNLHVVLSTGEWAIAKDEVALEEEWLGSADSHHILV